MSFATGDAAIAERRRAFDRRLDSIYAIMACVATPTAVTPSHSVGRNVPAWRSTRRATDSKTFLCSVPASLGLTYYNKEGQIPFGIQCLCRPPAILAASRASCTTRYRHTQCQPNKHVRSPLRGGSCASSPPRRDPEPPAGSSVSCPASHMQNAGGSPNPRCYDVPNKERKGD